MTVEKSKGCANSQKKGDKTNLKELWPSVFNSILQ